MQIRQIKHQSQRTRYSQHKPGESPPSRGRSSGDWFSNSSARGCDRRIHEHWIVEFGHVIAPGRNDYLRISSCV
jgi:hypothetical protein